MSISLQECAHHIFDRQALNTPDAVAIIHEDSSVTYSSVQRRSDCLANGLRSLGLEAGAHVGIYLRASPDAITATIATLKIGAVAVPLDGNRTVQQIESLVQHGGVKALLIDSSTRDNCPSAVPVIEIDQLVRHSGQTETPLPQQAVALDNPSFLLYTSGSISEPKGVVRTHRAIVERLLWAQCRKGDVFCHNMPLSFGFSQERLFIPLMQGASLAVLTETECRDVRALLKALARYRVTNLTIVPPMLQQFVEIGPSLSDDLASVRTISVGGGPLRASLAKTFLRLCPDTELFNAYGSTESGSVIRGRVGDFSDRDLVPLGYAVGNTRVHILDDQLRAVPEGREGEICVESGSVARGYFRDPARTGERFLQLPQNGTVPSVLLRTGDLGRVLENGMVEWIGRVDRQVKVRGYRVQLEEIEFCLRHHDAIEDAAATFDGDRLLAYVVPRPGARTTVNELYAYARSRLPLYMLPGAYLFVPELPLTPSGKIDYPSLPPWRPRRPQLDQCYSAPETETENVLASIWNESLGGISPGIDDSFLESGGDSLSAMHVLMKVEEHFGITVSITDFWKHSTIREMAALLDREKQPSPMRIECIPHMRRGIPALTSLLQKGALLCEMRADSEEKAYEQSLTTLCLKLSGRLDVNLLETALNTIVQRHEVLRTAFAPHITIGSKLKFDHWNYPRDFLKKAWFRQDVTIDFVHTVQNSVYVKLEYFTFEDRFPESELDKLVRTIRQTKFDYSAPPLVRAVLVRYASDRHFLVLAFSHLVCDGVSLSILHKELCLSYGALMSGRSPTLPFLAVQYLDWAAWTRQRLQGAYLNELLKYWRSQFESYSMLDIEAFHFCRPKQGPDSTAASETASLNINGRLALQALARAHGVSLYIVLLSTYYVLLCRLTARNQIGVGAFLANRVHRQTSNLIGWFAEFHMLGVRLDPHLHLHELLSLTQRCVAGATENQECSALLRLERGIGITRQPVTFEYRQYDIEHTGGGVSFERFTLPTLDESQWGLRWIITDRLDQLIVKVIYVPDRFASRNIHAAIKTFSEMLIGFPQSVNCTVREFCDRYN